MTPRFLRPAAGLILAHLFLTVAGAQVPRPHDKASFLQRGLDPSENSIFSPPSARISLTGSRENLVATATIGALLRDNVLELKVSGPIGKEAKETSLVSLSGLSKGASADFGYSRIFWNPTADAGKQRQVCIDYLVSLGKTPAEAVVQVDKGTFTCSTPNIKDPEFVDRLHRAVDWTAPRFLTARVKAGRDQFKFVQPPGYVDEKTVRNSYTLTVAAGVLTERYGILQAGFQYQGEYEPEDKSNICSPLAASTSSRCREISVGAPTRTIRRVIQAEQRKFVNSNFGIGAHFDYDLASGDWAFNVPIYVFRNKDKGFNGGVAAGFVSTEKAADPATGAAAKRTTAFVVNLFIGDVIGLIAR